MGVSLPVGLRVQACAHWTLRRCGRLLLMWGQLCQHFCEGSLWRIEIWLADALLMHELLAGQEPGAASVCSLLPVALLHHALCTAFHVCLGLAVPVARSGREQRSTSHQGHLLCPNSCWLHSQLYADV